MDGALGTIDPLPAFFVENALAELDEAEEWFFDSESSKLYFFHNATESTPPPEDWVFVVPDLARLVEVAGASSESPVQDVRIQGLGLRDASYTYMDAWGVPSGGDWALHRGGALFLERTQNVTISDCVFKRLDGNALMISGFNRATSVERNHFLWIGDCAMAAWGRTEEWDVLERRSNGVQ